MHYAEHIVDLVGNTPLLRLNAVAGHVAPLVLAKVEYLNPGGSVKDRIALRMVEAAERSGVLQPGGTIVEPTSGNTGVGLALIAQRKGYRCLFVCPDKVGQDKRDVLKAYGAEVVVCPTAVAADHPDSYYSVSDRMAEEIDGAWKPDQYSNPENPASHYHSTGPELWAQTEAGITHFVAGIGTGGTISGIGRYLKEQDPKVRVYAVEPDECALLARQEWGEHGIEGIGDGFVPQNLDLSILSGVITTTTQESIELARRLAREEGIFCGISSGCNVAAAVKLARRHPELESIAVLINDTGQRYFSTALCGTEKHVEVPDREHPIDPYSQEEIARYKGTWEIIS